MASIYRPTYTRGGVRKKLKKWYVKYRDADGVVRSVPGFNDKAATDTAHISETRYP